MMKKLIVSLMAVLLVFSAGCAANPIAQLANPWTEYATQEEAENAAGFTLDMNENIGIFTAVSFRVMGETLFEVLYESETDASMRLRKCAGDMLDISGDYTEYPNVEEFSMNGAEVCVKSSEDSMLILVSYEDFSYSAALSGDYPEDIVELIVNDVTD